MCGSESEESVEISKESVESVAIAVAIAEENENTHREHILRKFRAHSPHFERIVVQRTSFSK